MKVNPEGRCEKDHKRTRGTKVEIVVAEVQGFQHIIILTHHASVCLCSEFLSAKSSLLF